MGILDENYYQHVKRILDSADSESLAFEAIVDAPFHDKLATAHLGLGVVVLLLTNTTTQTIDRIALSKTDAAEGAVRMSAKPFQAIRIPLDYQKNLIVKTITQHAPQQTTDWKYLFTPELTAQEAHFNQAGAGIECSVVFPLGAGAPSSGALIFSYLDSPEQIGDEHYHFMEAYSRMASDLLARRGAAK